ncbi:MAG: ABC transporter substrate-binding protein [Pacificimonas sp.]
MTFRVSAIALALSAMAAPAMLAATPAAAQAATDADAKAAASFIDKLAGDAFDVIRDGDASSSATQAKLREMLAANFDVDYIGQYLIRSQKGSISREQYRDYMSVFPTWVVATYTNNLFAFDDSTLDVIRAVPAGSRGDLKVYTRVKPKSGSPINAIWSVRKVGGKFLIRNLEVSGVNMALTQEKDFRSYIANNGFDKLVALMKKRTA